MRSLTKTLLLALVLMAGSAGAWAHGHARLGVYIGGPIWGPWWWGPPVIYSAPVVERPVYADPPLVIEAAPPTEQYWYFCRAANAYYPYVKECPAGWEKVAPTPAGK